MNATKYPFCRVRFLRKVQIINKLRAISEQYADIRAYRVYYAVHKQETGMYKACAAACAWAARVHQSAPRPQAIRPPRRACVQAAAPDPPPNQEGIGEGGGKTPRRFQSYVYIISHPRVIPTPKGPYKTGGTLSKSASKKFQKSDKKTVLCWSCLSSADGQSSFTFLFPLVLSGARNTRQARRAQRRGITWASKRTSEQRRARL